MKNMLLVAVAMAAIALFAGQETYNDLGDCAGQDTAFWNTTAHPAPVVQAETVSFSGTLAAKSYGCAVAPLTVFDSRIFSCVYSVFDLFTTDPSGIAIIFR